MAWGSDEPKILIADIEISHDLVATYGLREQYHSPKNLVQHWFMICFAWQWLDGESVHGYSLLSDKKRFKKNHLDDRAVVEKLYSLLARADAVVGHNFERFDWKKFMNKVIKYGLKPISKPIFIDTCKEARKLAAFNSNSLAYLTNYLEVENQKQRHSDDMWMRILLTQDPKAIREALTYCKGDITATKDLYLKLRPYIENHINWNLWRADGVDGCRNCKGEHLNKHKVKVTRTGKYMQWQCQDCGAITAGVKRIKAAKMK